MIIKAGKFVSHAGALQWGAGKVLDVNVYRATIQFSDGISRKIAASHFDTLQPAEAASYLPPPEVVAVVKARPAPRKPKKKLLPPSEAQ
jgi:hypothetical protein